MVGVCWSLSSVKCYCGREAGKPGCGMGHPGKVNQENETTEYLSRWNLVQGIGSTAYGRGEKPT